MLRADAVLRRAGAVLRADAYAFHFSHDMFQPLRPLAGSTVSSWEFFTTTTSPRMEWLKNQAAGVVPS